ncbi:MAG: class I tRNA ligase family protein [Candidatus Paceibacterota bacterium]
MAEKSAHAEREEKILAFWKEKGIFEQTLAKPSPKGEFIFYEGPPTANGRPGIHHLEARAFKDAIPRYKTMRGFHVRRKGGWDTHGLPVELQVEKALGFKSKKEIEAYGIEAFNDKCKESVWTFVHEWEDFTRRMGYWVDLKDPYITYKPEYMESVWNVIKEADKNGLLYKDYKVVPWCPRCGTGLSSHELAQGYETVKDLSVYVKFKIKGKGNEYFLAWTTTPWTLPGNVGLAVGENIDYVQIRSGADSLILAKARLSVIKEQYVVEKEFKGKELVGMEYEPLYPFLRDNISGTEKEKLKNAYKVYAADFVTTEDGTGIVHTAVMYGQDDFELGTKVGLPKYHLVNDDGTFKEEAGFLAGKFVKEEVTDVEIIKDLAGRGLLFHKEKHEHSYPFCWRCKTPLIYFARDSWYIRMSGLRDRLVKENQSIHWEPAHIKDGRFGEWLREVKDWAISRERYWGTPLPIWACDTCKEKKVIGSVEELKQKSKNTYYVMRHGEAQNNILGIISTTDNDGCHLTELGREQVSKSAESLKGAGIDLIVTSPLMRTRETTEIVRRTLGLDESSVIVEDRVREITAGAWDGRKVSDFVNEFVVKNRFERMPDGAETYKDIKKRVGDVLYGLEDKYAGKTILVVSHGSPSALLVSVSSGQDRSDSLEYELEHYFSNAEVRKLDFSPMPHNHEYELDLHRPFIDAVKLKCSCGGEMRRVKEVMDVWFDSGAMPFAQDHYPFENKGLIAGGFLRKATGYPADFISEAIDQTRGWFYTLHAIGVLMGKGRAFKNVVCLGHILDAQGKKMSKSQGNVVDPWMLMDKYGADALRFWMYSVNQPGDSKNFDEKTVDEVNKKVFNLVANVTSFYKMYEDEKVIASDVSSNVLDRWIISRLNQVVANVTADLDKYLFLEPTREIREFIADLSQWYLRRSRDRFKGADRQVALETTKYVLLTIAKVMAPFTPFFAEYIYQEVGGDKESVHLEEWPEVTRGFDEKLVKSMAMVREIVSRGLEARMAAKINIRQPLSSFSIKEESLSPELANLVKDELNVKEIIFAAAEDKLDTTMTPELKEEGDLRELLRKIQDARKEKNLSVGDKAVVVATDDMKPLVSKYETKIKEATNLSGIEYGAVFGLK